VSAHEQAGLVAFVAGLATISADSLIQVAWIIGVGALTCTALLLAGRR
jgi:hypothetical protein